jgi:phage gpG-like protein
MSAKITMKFDDSNLKRLARELQNNKYVKVGVLSKDQARSIQGSDTQSNADIGALHEFGSIGLKIPKRSFLNMPINENSNRIVKAVSASIKANIMNTDINQHAMEAAGVAAEGIVQQAFETGGFGKWAPLSPITIQNKGSETILVDTGQLRQSISSEVVDNV